MKEQANKPKGAKKVIKTIFNTIINILIVVVLLCSLLIAVMALTSKANGVSTIFGYTIQTVQSDSMKGTSPDGYEGGDFEKGDVIIGKATDFVSDAEYELGDIVTYVTQDTDDNDVLIVHRIVDVVDDGNGNLSYQTQGDNRVVAEVPDQQTVDTYLRASDIASVFYSESYHGSVIKGVGSALDYLRTQEGFFLCVLLPMIIFFMYEIIRVVLNTVNYKKAKSDEEKENAEKEKQEAIDAAVAQALSNNGAETPADSSMTAEQMEQFKQFMEFQKMQNSAKADEAKADEAKAEDNAE